MIKSISIFLGHEMIDEEFLETIFISKINSLKTQLKNDFNIEIPTIELHNKMRDESQLSKREIILEIDGSIKWKQDFADNEDFDIIFDIVLDNLKNTIT